MQHAQAAAKFPLLIRPRREQQADDRHQGAEP